MIKTIKLAKKGKFIYNILSVSREVLLMFSWQNKKSKRIISSIIIILLILAMVVPLMVATIS